MIASPALHASLVFPNANEVAVASSIDFLPAEKGLNQNQINLARYFNAAAEAGPAGLNPLLLALVNGPSNMTDYEQALNRLMPEVFLNSQTMALQSSSEFSSDLFSCHIGGSGTAFIRQNECFWVRPKSRWFDFDGTSENLAFDNHTAGLSAGAQFSLAPDWFANVALGYERGTTQTSSGAESTSDHFQAGVSLKYQTGPWLFAGAVSAGIAQFETARPVGFPGFANSVARSDHDVGTVTGHLQANYLMDFGAWYAKPTVDLQLTHLDRDGTAETGGGSANLRIGGGSESYISMSPAVEVGTEYSLDQETTMKPYLKAGILYVEGTEASLSADFIDGPAGISGFSMSSEMDDIYANIEAGIQLFKQNGTSLSFGYKGLISEDAHQSSVFAKGTVKF